ncbi:membrane protein insertion efficiency factor YidD [candidate division KSB1 bacterium]
MKHILIFTVKLYQMAISPLFPAVCRFDPSCSQYAVEAIKKHGAVRGCYMAFSRILRCHPFSKRFGYDPVK